MKLFKLVFLSCETRLIPRPPGPRPQQQQTAFAFNELKCLLKTLFFAVDYISTKRASRYRREAFPISHAAGCSFGADSGQTFPGSAECSQCLKRSMFSQPVLTDMQDKKDGKRPLWYRYTHSDSSRLLKLSPLAQDVLMILAVRDQSKTEQLRFYHIRRAFFRLWGFNFLRVPSLGFPPRLVLPTYCNIMRSVNTFATAPLTPKHPNIVCESTHVGYTMTACTWAAAAGYSKLWPRATRWSAGYLKLP